MIDPDEELQEKASVDEAIERMEEHVSERDAHEDQGLIEKRTRDAGLDDG
ncbi:MAG: hypothetical protein KDC39_07925 [Actinobacteria bacterium]|nr:hypothetical protein [Actinomycetota bacterium]